MENVMPLCIINYDGLFLYKHPTCKLHTNTSANNHITTAPKSAPKVMRFVRFQHLRDAIHPAKTAL